MPRIAAVVALLWTSTTLIAADMPSGREHVNPIGMKLVRIEPGAFLMGGGEAPPKSRGDWATRDRDEARAHKVTIGRAFFLGAYEVTNAQYERFSPGHKELRGKKGASRKDDEPVTFV